MHFNPWQCSMAEIGDVCRFPRKQSLVAFAGIDPASNDSGDKYGRNSGTTKRGSPYLHKTLFNIMKCYLQNVPENEPVFQFIDKKCTEDKPYYVYMTAAANKFLRRYYAKVNEYLSSSENTFSEWGGFAALICYTTLFRQDVKDAIGVAKLFILDWQHRANDFWLTFHSRRPFCYVVFYLPIYLQKYLSFFDFPLDFLFVGFLYFANAVKIKHITDSFHVCG